MARITHVKRARQRYETVPVLDDQGEQVIIPVTNKDGSPKTDKHGRQITIRKTTEDLTKPLPPRTCEHCGEPIEVGTPYKHVTPRSGPYGGQQRNRHETCPTWQIWELSNSWSARAAQAVDGFDGAYFTDEATGPDDIDTSEVADAIRELAEESREAAENIRDGFGHDTWLSEEADSRADELDQWADEVENVDLPDLDDPEEVACPECEGEGRVENPDYDADDEDSDEEEEIDCPDCDGTGRVEGEEHTEEQLNDWRDEAAAAIDDVLGACPV